MPKSSFSILALCAVCTMAPGLSGEDPAETPTSGETDYHFFVGVELSVPYEDAYYPVERIWNARAQIKVDDEIVALKVKNIKELRVDRKAKVRPDYVEISDLQCEPVYSASRDPKTIAARNELLGQSMASEASAEVDSALRQSASPQAFRAGPTTGLGGGGLSNADAEMERLQSIESTYSSTDIQSLGPAFNKPSWDMLHVSFSIRSKAFYPSGHLVFIFQLKDSPEGEPVLSWFHFLSLEDISPQGKDYDYRLAEYPDGMYIDSQEAFLFINGSEVATNLSPKHVEMTEKDARVFLKYRYLAENNGKTRPPDRAWKYLRPRLRDKLMTSRQEDTLTLQIDAEGLVQDITMSPSIRKVLAPRDVNEIASQLYLPALENGKPVAGELILPLKDLVF